MLRCEHCGVGLPGAPRACPLCQGALTGEPDETGRAFPDLPEGGSVIRRKLLSWIAFGTACMAAVCIAINLILPAGGGWSLFVAAGIASLWIDFGIMLKKWRNLPKSILWQVAVVSLIAYVWDRFTGFHGWSVDYVLPILCICAMIAMTVVSKIRKLHAQDYVLYLGLDCMLGLVSFVLILTGAVRVVTPSALCFASSLIFLAFLLFFEGKSVLDEIKRRTHL